MEKNFDKSRKGTFDSPHIIMCRACGTNANQIVTTKVNYKRKLILFHKSLLVEVNVECNRCNASTLITREFQTF